MLAGVVTDIPDTRSSRLKAMRGAHLVVDELLAWSKAGWIATTYGYAWLDDHVGPGDRLRGVWTASDGAAGRMTACASFHNLPAELRPADSASAATADPGHVLVRADLGQFEPRVLGAISADRRGRWPPSTTTSTPPSPSRLGIERRVAKVTLAIRDLTDGREGALLNCAISAGCLVTR